MKIPKSIRDLYRDLLPRYQRLKEAVDALVQGRKQTRWHYEGRIKQEESFAQKLETGREKNPGMPEDLFACTLVVENHARIAVAEQFVSDNFRLHQRRPRDAHVTHLAPHSFDFDDLRLYVKWKEDTAQRPSGLDGLLFEVQIKTFLQHAWGIATHDFIYKSDDVDWPTSRIAYQVKAMLDNAELSISEAKKLTTSTMLSKCDEEHADLRDVINDIKGRWEANLLPKDLRRMAITLQELSWKLRISFKDIWGILDEATAAGEGAKTVNLSPYAAVLAALLAKRGGAVFNPLGRPELRGSLFVPLEIELPSLPGNVMARIVRPPALGKGT
jgi:ppGpp synthetase/RelA/SpoT-type nucleotidyltranferase